MTEKAPYKSPTNRELQGGKSSAHYDEAARSTRLVFDVAPVGAGRRDRHRFACRKLLERGYHVIFCGSHVGGIDPRFVVDRPRVDENAGGIDHHHVRGRPRVIEVPHHPVGIKKIIAWRRDARLSKSPVQIQYLASCDVVCVTAETNFRLSPAYPRTHFHAINEIMADHRLLVFDINDIWTPAAAYAAAIVAKPWPQPDPWHDDPPWWSAGRGPAMSSSAEILPPNGKIQTTSGAMIYCPARPRPTWSSNR